MNGVVMAWLLGIGTLVQGHVWSPGVLGGARVPALLSVVLYYALHRDLRLTLAAGLVAGLLVDGLGRIPPGYSSACFMGLGAGVHASRGILQHHWLVTACPVGLAAAAAAAAVMYGLLWATGQVALPLHTVYWKVGGAAAWGAVAAPVACLAGARMDEALGNTMRVEEVPSSGGAHIRG